MIIKHANRGVFIFNEYREIMTGNMARQREREIERKRFWERGREGEKHSSERKWHGLILTIQSITTME
jgi:hypothetical protein